MALVDKKLKEIESIVLWGCETNIFKCWHSDRATVLRWAQYSGLPHITRLEIHPVTKVRITFIEIAI